jgi:hypothetical protein
MVVTPTGKQARTNAGSEMSGIKTLLNTPFNMNQTLKHEVRGRFQQKFDLWITELWVRLGLPWSILDHPT